MAFYFPKDEELFEDLENIGERSEDLSQLIRLFSKVEGAKNVAESEDDDGNRLKELYGDESEAQEKFTAFLVDLCARYYGGDWDALWNDAEHGSGLFDTNAFGEKIRNIKKSDKGFVDSIKWDSDAFEKTYLLHEKCAASAVLSSKIGWFPRAGMLMYQQIDLATKEMKFESYFSEMCRHFQFMQGVGKVGEILKQAKLKLAAVEKSEEACKAKAEKAALFPLYFLLMGTALILCGGAALPVIPDFLSLLLNNSLPVRLIVLALMVVTALLVMGMTKFMMEEDSGAGPLMKLVGNGIVTLLISIGAILVTLSSFGEINPIDLLPFGVYFLLYGACFMLEDAAQRRKQKKALAEAKREAEAQKTEFCKLVEENIQYLHRYIRFHVLWHKSIYGDRGHFRKGIDDLQASFDHLLTMYNRYS